MKNVNSFEEFINEGVDRDIFSHNVVPVDKIKELMNQFDISEEEAEEVNDVIEKVLDMDDLDDRMDYVDTLTLDLMFDDEDKADEIMEYIKDICIS